MFRFLIKIAFVILLGLGVYYVFHREEVPMPSNIPEIGFLDLMNEVKDLTGEEGEESTDSAASETEEETATSPEEVPVNESEESAKEESDEKPEVFNLAVPFTSQAPHADWALPYGEACEEASAFMVAEYFAGKSGRIDADAADAAILELIEFEKDFLGVWLDTTASETAQLIDAFYGLKAIVVENPSIADIKAEIAAGRPVIVPAAGRELGNPNFTGEGPLYHMLVIKGYTETTFITNDPGTRNGQNFEYRISVLMDAMGDWNDGDPANGAKRVIFVAKE